MSEQISLRVGMSVEILIPLDDGIAQRGIIYDYLPSRPWPYHVRPDGWEKDAPGIAFSADEIKPLEQERTAQTGNPLDSLEARL
jgi:hypothetical protein